MIKVVKTDNIIPVLDEFTSVFNGLDVDFVCEHCETEEDLIRVCADADGILTVKEPFTANVIASLSRCKVISRFGIGLDNIDLEAARASGIVVANVPDGGVEEVSTHAVAMILALIRRLPHYDRAVRDGEFQGMRIGAPIRRTTKMTVGLIGLGRIGAMTARKLSAFGFTLWGYDPHVSDAVFADCGIERRPLDDIIAQADVLSFHTPLTPETAGLIDAARIQAMKPGAILVNVSRGGLVDEVALARALTEGKLAGAGIDTFAIEPLPADSPLRTAPHLLLSPHAASISQDSVHDTCFKAFVNVAKVFSD